MLARPTNPDAADLAMQGWSLLNQSINKVRFYQARAIFEASLKLDDHETSSLVGLATILVVSAEQRWSEHSEHELEYAENLIAKALELAPKLGAAHRVRSWLLGYKNLLAEAIAAAEVAIELNRNDNLAHQLLALFELQSGDAGRSRALIEQAIRLSPRDPNQWGSLQILARAEIALGELEAALDHLHKAIIANPEMRFIRLFLATAHARAGREQEARKVIAGILSEEPDLLVGQSAAVQSVMRVQLELAARGYYLGTVDGRIGAFTQRAIAEFQRDCGIAVSGDLDASTLTRLKLDS
jgi:tetratricopeptide (TPR) repeat protein